MSAPRVEATTKGAEVGTVSYDEKQDTRPQFPTEPLPQHLLRMQRMIWAARVLLTSDDPRTRHEAKRFLTALVARIQAA